MRTTKKFRVKKHRDIQLSQLVDMEKPSAVFEEVKYNFIQYYSITDFIEKYFKQRKFFRKDLICARNIIRCTGLNTDIESIKFSDRMERTLGLMLGTADLIGQIASRTYLESLLFLYNEFKEGKVSGYNSEFDLLKRTIGFYTYTKNRLGKELGNVYKFALPHFQERYGINVDLYQIAMHRQIKYLKNTVTYGPESYRDKLKRQL